MKLNLYSAYVIDYTIRRKRMTDNMKLFGYEKSEVLDRLDNTFANREPVHFMDKLLCGNPILGGKFEHRYWKSRIASARFRRKRREKRWSGKKTEKPRYALRIE